MDDADRVPPVPPPALEQLLDGAPPAASADALRAVVGRHRRWELRVLGPCLATVLVAAAAGGFAIGRDNGADRSTAVSTTQAGAAASASGGAAATGTGAGTPDGAARAPAPGAGGVAATAPGFGSAQPAKQLVLRTATDGTQVRLYSSQFPTLPGGPVGAGPPCAPARLDAQVSNRQVAGQQSVFLWGPASTATVALGGGGVVGVGDPTPIAVVVVRTGPEVTGVSLAAASYGSDVSAPTDGLAVLVLTLPADYQPAQTLPLDKAGASGPPFTPLFPSRFPAATVTAHNRAGAVIGTLSLPGSSQLGPPPECRPEPPCFAPPPPPTTVAIPPSSTPAPPPRANACCAPPVALTTTPAPSAGKCCGQVVTNSSGTPPPVPAKGVPTATEGTSAVAPAAGLPAGAVVNGCVISLPGSATVPGAASPPALPPPTGAAPEATPGR